MRRMPWATYLWPGLPQLWLEGAWSGLMLAFGFTLLLNALVLTTCVWVELVDPPLVRLGWIAVGCVWTGSLAVTLWLNKPRKNQLQDAGSKDLFRTALSEYLKGNWFEAESVWTELVGRNPRDIEARLMLVALLRRTKRWPEAGQQLARLERLEGSELWAPEIEREREWMTQTQADPADRMTENLKAHAAPAASSQAA